MLTIEKLKEYGTDIEKGMNLCMNNEDFYLRMVSMILSEASFDDLSRALEADDLDGAFKAAHALKGVSGNLSLTGQRRRWITANCYRGSSMKKRSFRI